MAAFDDTLRRSILSSLASGSSVLSYAVLLEKLHLPRDEELESFLIASVYEGFIKGEIDPLKREFHVQDFTVSKLDKNQLPEVATHLADWVKRTEDILAKIEAKIGYSDRNLFEKISREQVIEDSVAMHREANNILEMPDPVSSQGSSNYDGPKEAKRLRSRDGL